MDILVTVPCEHLSLPIAHKKCVCPDVSVWYAAEVLDVQTRPRVNQENVRYKPIALTFNFIMKQTWHVVSLLNN